MINHSILKSVGELSEIYSNNLPFPHIVLDDFLDDRILNYSLNELKEYRYWHSDKTDYVKDYQVNKFYTPSAEDDAFESLEVLSKNAPITMEILNYLRSEDCMQFFERLTGIPSLLSDNDWLGGGAHKITSGGKLGVHIDFNIHWKMNLHRRLNVLLYLNKNWKDEYNGHLELWEKDCSKCIKKISPVFNRMVVFNTTEYSYHGHPIPLNTPKGIDRYSLALYFYTKERPEEEIVPFHPVVWKDITPL